MKKHNLYFFICCLTITSCAKQSTNLKHQNITIDPNGISIFQDGKIKASGGHPGFQSKDFKLDEVDMIINDSTYEISFSSNTSQEPVIVKAYQKRFNTFCFSLSPNGNHSSNGIDFIGFFFSSIPGYSKGIASHLFGDWKAWTKPLQVKDYQNTKEKNLLFFLWQYEDGGYAAAMPLAGKGYNSSLGSEGSTFGSKAVNYLSNSHENDIPLFAISFGDDPYKVVENLYMSGMSFMHKENNLRSNKKYPEIFEKIGWCTWNALGEKINEDKLLDAVATFTSNDFRLPWLLIDNGWLHITDSLKLVSMEADKNKFSAGLKHVVNRLKQEHGVEHVGLWHTLNGYWKGIDPKSELAERFKNNLSPYRDKYSVHDDLLSEDIYFGPSIQKGKGIRFYDEWYSYFKGEGISFLKVDQQCVIPRIARGQIGQDKLPYWGIAENLVSNLQHPASGHFDGNIINCMNMPLEVTYNFGNMPIARSSDDYFPTRTAYFSHEIEKGNAAVHTLVNLHNSVWYSQMVWPDFDMFQTHHENAEYHAVTRAISGGPVYITDETGQQNFDILRKITYSDGSILRADLPARPTRDCLFQVNELKPFKAFTLSKHGALLAAYNTVDAEVVHGTFRASDVEGLKGDKFAIYEHFSGDLFIAARDQELSLTLGRMECRLYSIVSIEGDGLALIGLTGKYNSPGTVLNYQIMQDAISLSVKEEGEFLVYLERSPTWIQLDGRKMNKEFWEYNEKKLIINIPKKSKGSDINIIIHLT